MPATATQTTGIVFVGRCGTCKTRYSYTETARGASTGYAPNKPYCGCRAGIPCDKWNCLDGPHDHEFTAISFKMVEVTTTDTPCGASCMTASSNKCACSCGGEHHGEANRLPARNA
jgi:hypothetical protein